MRSSLKIFCLFLFLTIGLRAEAGVRTWPVIRPVHAKHTFVLPSVSSDADFGLYIQNLQGAPIYRLECHNGNYPFESGIKYSGDFQCALFAFRRGAITSGDLLAANTKDELSSDWWNRGRVLARQLRGKCLAYPEYSTLRHFKLRGMLLTFGFSDFRWGPSNDSGGPPWLKKFTFTLDVVPDRVARSYRAELPAGPKPPSSCYP